MKFNNLTVIQRIAILADLSGLLYINSVHDHAVSVMDKIPDAYTRLGFKTPIPVLRSRNEVDVIIKRDEEGHSRRILRFRELPNATNKVSFNCHLVENHVINKTCSIGRFGLTTDFVLTNDLTTGLETAATLIRSFEDILKLNKGISKVLEKLLKTIPKAEAIHENLLDVFYLNRPVSDKLLSISTLLEIQTEPFLFTDDTVRPEYIINSPRRDNRFEVVKVVNNGDEEDLRLRLVIDLGYIRDDVVNVYSKKGKTGSLVKIGRVVLEDIADPKEFLKTIRNGIDTIVLESDKRDELLNKVNAFLELWDELTPSFIKQLENG